MNWKITLAIVVPLLLLAAVGLIVWLVFFQGETTQQVLARHQGDFDAKRRELTRVAESLPPAGSVRGNVSKRLDPPPCHDPDEPERINCSVLMAEHLRDPDQDIKTPQKPDFILSDGHLRMYLQWTGPRNPMSPSAWHSRARANMDAEAKRVLGQPYLIVVRPVSYEQPMLIGPRSFVGGTIDSEAFVYDWRVGKVEAAVRIAAKSDDLVSGVKDKLEDWIYSSMMTNARRRLAQGLAEATGGSFDFEFGLRR